MQSCSLSSVTGKKVSEGEWTFIYDDVMYLSPVSLGENARRGGIARNTWTTGPIYNVYLIPKKSQKVNEFKYSNIKQP